MNKNVTPKYPRVFLAASWLIVATIIVLILTNAASLLIPLVFAILIWYLIKTVEYSLSRIKFKKWHIPRWLRILLTLVIFGFIFNTVAGIITTSVSSIIQIAPQYQANLEKMLFNFEKMLVDLPLGIEIEEVPALTQFIEQINIGVLMQRIARELTGLMSNIGLIFIYLIFLFLEQRYFSNKIKMISGEDQRKQKIDNILSQIDKDIKKYVGVKTLLSFITSVGAWLIMRWVGLDFAEFWALLIFILNFIPHLGSIGATLMPALLALLQFDTLKPFFIILIGVFILQFGIGNLLDPALLGRSLNVSPLVLIFSLLFWGVIWGTAGMFLAVPVTVILMIVFNNFQSTQWIARALSKKGNLKNSPTPNKKVSPK
ncbi:MAG: AI-2E family transporter [Elusimicrobiota bacterium]